MRVVFYSSKTFIFEVARVLRKHEGSLQLIRWPEIVSSLLKEIKFKHFFKIIFLISDFWDSLAEKSSLKIPWRIYTSHVFCFCFVYLLVLCPYELTCLKWLLCSDISRVSVLASFKYLMLLRVFELQLSKPSERTCSEELINFH